MVKCDVGKVKWRGGGGGLQVIVCQVLNSVTTTCYSIGFSGCVIHLCKVTAAVVIF